MAAEVVDSGTLPAGLADLRPGLGPRPGFSGPSGSFGSGLLRRSPPNDPGLVTPLVSVARGGLPSGIDRPGRAAGDSQAPSQPSPQNLSVSCPSRHPATGTRGSGRPMLVHRDLFPSRQAVAGLDECEGRSWNGWHHNMALFLLSGTRLVNDTRPRAAVPPPPARSPCTPGGPRAINPGAGGKQQRATQVGKIESGQAHAVALLLPAECPCWVLSFTIYHRVSVSFYGEDC